MRLLFVLGILIVTALAGCVADDRPLVVRSGGEPVVFAQAIVYREGIPVAKLSSWYDGELELNGIRADSLTVWAPGHKVWRGAPDGAIDLVPGDDVPPPGALVFDAPAAMPCDDPVWNAKQLALDGPTGTMDVCGGGEPVLEVQPDGDLFFSTTVFLGSAPPLWKSEDGGVTWNLFRGAGTGAVREVTGTEVDMATDVAGNLYVIDENFAINWFTAYSDDDQHRFTHALPMAPKTHDRPWVVARAEDEVAILYSDQHISPRTSYFFRSDDGGLTWPAEPEHVWPCAQMLQQGPTPDRLMIAGVLGCDGTAGNLAFDALYFRESLDFGATWSVVEEAPLPSGDFEDRAMWVILNPVADAAGNTYIAYTHAVDKEAMDVDIHIVRRAPDGTWAGPWRVGAPGTNMLPWIAAAGEGEVAVSWYHADAPARQDLQQDAEWHIVAAVSVDAHTDRPHFMAARPDARLVYPGPGMYVTDNGLGRDGPAFLADFTAIEFLTDGALGVGYSRSDTGDHYHSEPHFVRTPAKG